MSTLIGFIARNSPFSLSSTPQVSALALISTCRVSQSQGVIKSLIASLHFTLKIISMSKLTRQKFLQDLDPSISSTSSKLTCRLRSKSQLVETSSKLTCRLHSKSQLVDSAPNSTCRLNLSTPLQTHLSTQLVDFIQTQLVDFIQTHSSTLPETPRKSQLVDLVDSTRKSRLPIISKISTLVRCFKHPSSPSACAHLDLSSLSISRCFQQLSNSRQRHFKTSLVDLVDLVDLFPQNDPKTHSKPHAFVNVFSRSTFSVALSRSSLKTLAQSPL